MGIIEVSVTETAPAQVTVVTGGASNPTSEYANYTSHVYLSRISQEPLGGHRCVIVDDAGFLMYADSADVNTLKHPVWLTLGSSVADEAVNVLAFGDVTEPSWNWTAGSPAYLGTNGVLTQTVPTVGFILAVGVALTVTSIFYHPSVPIVLGS